MVTLYLKLAHVGDFDADELRDDYFQDPQRVLGPLRESRSVSPVDLSGNGRAWLVTRYEDVRAALADPRLAKDLRKLYPDWTPGLRQAMFSLHMLNLDPPDHTRLRRLVQKAFTPGRVAALRDHALTRRRIEHQALPEYAVPACAAVGDRTVVCRRGS